MAVQIVGQPQPATVKDTDTGAVVDGYRFIVQDTETGARAMIELPQDKFTPANVEVYATHYLDNANAVLAKFGAGNARPTPPAST